MMLVRQRTRHDCGVCTLAMATGKSYEEVIETALRVEAFDPAKGFRAEYRVLEEFGLEQMVDFRLMHRGILSAEFFLHFSWRRRSILAVPSLNTEGVFHSVYWSGETLYDPCELKTYSAWKDLRPDELIVFAR